MKKRIKNFLFLFFLAATLIVVIPGQMDGKDGDRCACYDEEEAKKACAFLNEYKSSTLLSGTCYGPSCKARVKVYCVDKDDGNAPYSHTVTVWGDNCADCNGGGIGGGGSNAGFEDINGDYGHWHNPNWY